MGYLFVGIGVVWFINLCRKNGKAIQEKGRAKAFRELHKKRK